MLPWTCTRWEAPLRTVTVTQISRAGTTPPPKKDYRFNFWCKLLKQLSTAGCRFETSLGHWSRLLLSPLLSYTDHHRLNFFNNISCHGLYFSNNIWGHGLTQMIIFAILIIIKGICVSKGMEFCYSNVGYNINPLRCCSYAYLRHPLLIIFGPRWASTSSYTS